MNGIGRMTCTLAIGSSSYRIQADICCVFSRISVQEDRPYSNTACTVMIAAFALIDDGVPALILEEERFNREKHTQEFPRLSLEAAFAQMRLGIRDIDVITTPWDMRALRRTSANAVLGSLPWSLSLLWPGAHAAQDSGIVLLPFWLKFNLRCMFGRATLPK